MPRRSDTDARRSPPRRGSASTRRACGLIAISAWLLACVHASARETVFQYATALTTSKQKSARALLWLPPDADRIRGAVLCGTTLMERDFVRDPTIRAACREERLALVLLSCGLSQADLHGVLADLAEASGYEELASAPLLFVGHSAGGPQAQARATELSERCFGLIQYRGGTPSAEAPIPAGVPALAMVGQFDEFGGAMRDASGAEDWERGVAALAGFRSLGPDRLGALVVEPGAGHFAWSERNAVLAALFIRKAAAAIHTARDGAAATLRRPRHEDGWLTGLSPRGEIECAPFAAYRGDRAWTSWHADEAMARATLAYHRELVGRKDQFLTWEHRFWVDAGARFFFFDLEWVGDGQSFAVRPVYADVYPSQHKGRGPRWPLAGAPAGNCGGPIRIKTVGGPIVPDGPRRFRIRHDALAPAGGNVRGTFVAYSEGDDEYRYTEQVGMMPRGFKGLTDGSEQTITFPPIADVARDAGPIELRATSDSGLRVEYYVNHGPAVVEDGKLILRDVPARARFPVEIEVVAWQFGRGTEPRIKSAAPVARTTRVTVPGRTGQ